MMISARNSMAVKCRIKITKYSYVMFCKQNYTIKRPLRSCSEGSFSITCPAAASYVYISDNEGNFIRKPFQLALSRC